MKKNRRLIILAVPFLLIALYFFKDIRSIPYRLYSGDRITGSVRLVIDGEDYPIEEDNIRLDSKGSVGTNDDGSASVSIKGGDYGEYRFYIYAPQLDKSLPVTCFQRNWWNVTDFEMTVLADTSSGDVVYDVTYSFLEDGGVKGDEHVTVSANIKNNDCGMFFGL